MSEHDTGGQSGRLRSRLRLIPLTSVMPMLSAAAGADPSAAGTDGRPRDPAVAAARTEPRRAAEGIVALCAQVLRGRHPLSAVRRVADATAFRQFTALYRRTRPARPNAEPVSLRLSHATTDPTGALTMVAMMNVGDRIRAVSLCARPRPSHGWQLTLCQLIERR